MMKFLMIIMSILLAYTSHSQSDSISDIPSCDIKIAVDSYTKKKTIESQLIDFNKGTYQLSKNKGVVNLWIQLQSSKILTIKKGEIFYIKFKDDSIIKFIIQSTNISDYSNGTFSNSFSFDLINNNLQQLKTKKIKAIKCYINEYIFEDDVPIIDNAPNTFINNLNCIVNAK